MAIIGKVAKHNLSLLLDKPWFLPIIICLFINALGIVLSVYLRDVELHSMLAIQEPRQRSILGIMSSSLMTLIAVTFSISMLILSTVSNQFGPRLLPNFIHSKISQLTLGFFLGTFIFCLFSIYYPAPDVIRGVQTVYAFILTVSCLFILVLFMNYVISSIRIDGILSQIVGETKRAIEGNCNKQSNPGHKTTKLSFDHTLNQLVIKSIHNGYIEAIDYEAIKKIADKNKLQIYVLVKPGDYVYQQEHLMILLNDHHTDERKLEKSLLNTLNIINMRTLNQDIEYGFDQISEIGVRALSPGINDPYTARECAFLMGELLLYLDQYENIELNTIVENDKPLVYFKSLTYQGVVDAALSRLRQATKIDVTIILAIFDMIIKTAPLLKRKSLAKALLNQAEQLYTYLQEHKLMPHDLKAINEREKIIQEISSNLS